LGSGFKVCSGSEACRLIDCVYHSTLGLRVIKKKKRMFRVWVERRGCGALFRVQVFRC